jgi:integrase
MAILHRKNRQGKYIGWQVMIDRRDPVTRERNRTVIGTYPTKREAERAEAQAITERERGTLLTPDKTTVGTLLDRYVEIELPKSVKLENQAPYLSIINRHLKPALGHVLARKLTVQHVDRLLTDMREKGFSSSTITKARMRLSSALDLGVRWGIVPANVAKLAPAPSISYKRARIWTREEVERFVVAAQTAPHWPMWLLMVDTGARQSELLGLSWPDTDLDKGTVRLGRQVVRLLKGTPVVKEGGKSRAAGRTIGLTPGTVEVLRRYRPQWVETRLANGRGWNPHELLFTTAAGTPLSANNLRKVFDRIVASAGVPPITPHAVRKTFITLALANGSPPKAVAARVGHADSRITLDTYSQVTQDMDDTLLRVASGFIPQEHPQTS